MTDSHVGRDKMTDSHVGRDSFVCEDMSPGRICFRSMGVLEPWYDYIRA